MTESSPDVAARIDALLPQTQCTRCGYPGCRPYADAIAGGEAQINRCPPGGSATIEAIATLLGRPFLALDPVHGTETAARVAWIDETRCIGCARCLPPCPVDAIVGAPKFMHTVLTQRCTGCELCVASCPVDCIDLRPFAEPVVNDPQLNRMRFTVHTQRLLQRTADRQRALMEKRAAILHYTLSNESRRP